MPIQKFLPFACLLATQVFVLVAAPDTRDRPTGQAKVDPQPISLPIVDGTDIRFTRLSTAGELWLTKVASIVQDNQGFMWFGTQYGLYRFDGYNLKVFEPDPNNSSSISGVFISTLFKDRNGALWAGCEQFLNKFDPATETFSRYPIPSVLKITQDRAGTLWLATLAGLYGLNPATGNVLHFSHNPNDSSSISSNDVQFCGEDKEGRFWVADSDGLEEFDRKTGKVTLHVPLHEPSSGFSFYEDRFGVFWIYHLSPNALAVFDRKKNTLIHFSFERGHPARKELTGVSAILEDGDGTLWFATHGAGLLKFDREHKKFVRYRNDPADPDSLPQNNVETIYADREGSIWAGLGRRGIARFATRSPPFQRFPHLDSPSNTVQPFVGAVYEDHAGVLWIGTPAALNRINRQTPRYSYYRRTVGPVATTDVIAITEDLSGTLWVGTYGHGLLKFDRSTGHFKAFQHDPANPFSLASDIITHLLVDHTGRLWVAGSKALNRFDPAAERFTTYMANPDRNPYYLDLVEDRTGALWLGTESSGLYRFDPPTGQFTNYQHDINNAGTLSDNRVNSVFFDRSEVLWVGTQNGLNQFDSKSGTFTSYGRSQGLPGNVVGRILEDDHGDLWMGTNNGVARFDPRTRKFQNYSTMEGLPGPDLTGWSAGFKSRSGEMFLGGFSGATAFFPDRVTEASYAPPVVLTDLLLSANAVRIGGSSPLQRSISYTHDLFLTHDQNVVSFTFAALSFSNPATNRYRYKLEDLQQDWTEVSSDRRQATYTTLPAGSYTFRVQGATGRGPWSEPGVVLHVQILPPWWATWWFRAIVVAAATFLVWVVYLSRLRQATEAVQARLGERLVERERIARELHDTLLQGFSGLALRFQAVLKQIPDQTPAHQMMEKALERVDEVLLEGRNRVRELRAEAIPGHELPRLLMSCGEELSQFKPTIFSLTVEGTAQPLNPVVVDEGYWIGRELLTNAFQHSGAAKIESEIIYERGGFHLRVRDDGCGMDQKMLSEGRPGHWGITGIRERAQNIGGKLSIWSKAGHGTEVELMVPATIAYQQPPGRLRWHLIKFIPYGNGKGPKA